MQVSDFLAPLELVEFVVKALINRLKVLPALELKLLDEFGDQLKKAWSGADQPMADLAESVMADSVTADSVPVVADSVMAGSVMADSVVRLKEALPVVKQERLVKVAKLGHV